MKFQATILQTGKTTTGIPVPDAVIEELGAGKKPKVRVTIHDYTYRTSIASMDGKFMLSVSAEVRENAGVAGGDTVEVHLELDTEPREVTIPDDFADALSQNKQAKQFFDGLSYSNKRRLVLAIEGAKKAETRQRRIGKTVDSLAEGKA